MKKLGVGVWFFMWIFCTIMAFFVIWSLYAYQDSRPLISTQTKIIEDDNIFLAKKIWADYINLENTTKKDIFEIDYYISYYEWKYSSGKIDKILRGKNFDIKLDRTPKNILINHFQYSWENYSLSNSDPKLIEILK